MDWLPVLTEALIPLAIIVVAYMLRNRVGETEADRIVKLAGQRAARVNQYVNAANIAVTAVEKGIKKYGTASDQDLQAAALDIMLRTLREWGVAVDPDNAQAMIGLVEFAYQSLKDTQMMMRPSVVH